jgi:hypothetical protein
MKKSIALCALAGSLMLTLPACAPVETLKITAIGSFEERIPMAFDGTLKAHIEATALGETGVECTWATLPQEKSIDTYVQETLGSGALPPVLLLPSLYDAYNATAEMSRQLITQQDLVWKITPELIRKYMPNYTARIRKYGQTVEKVLAMNAVDGENPYLPVHLPFGAFPGLLDHPGSKDIGSLYNILCFRDDILKDIFPSARTEAELAALYVKQGSLDVADIIGDIPITSLDDLYHYLLKVKSLNLKVGTSPLIPGAPATEFMNGERRIDSLDWSLRSAFGFRESYPVARGDPPDWQRTEFPVLSAEYKEYLAWWNKIYNAGLTDPNLFVQTREEYLAKRMSGAYAVTNNWWSMDLVRAAAKDRGYGYRSLPAFYGKLKNLWDNYTLPFSLKGDPLVFTRSIRESDLPRVLRWADWYLGEERDTLAYWGMPDWYTGKGTQRAFTTEHSALADWAVYGIASPHDGAFYGLANRKPAAYDPATNDRVPPGPLAFFSESLAYPDAPYYICKKEPAKVLQGPGLADYVYRVLNEDCYDHQVNVIYVGQGYDMPLWWLPQWYQYSMAIYARQEEYDGLWRDIVRGRPQDFERNYDAWVKIMEDSGIEAGRQGAIEFMTKVYPVEIAPNIIRNRTGGN